MSKTQSELITRAMKKHHEIYPCGTKTTLSEGFTQVGSRLLFWFNTKDGSTHIEVQSA